MFNFKEGLEVIVNRTLPVRHTETSYNNTSYPYHGWKGILKHKADFRSDDEWIIKWHNKESGDLIKEWMIVPVIEQKPFKTSDKVVYISGRHGDSKSNPLWNGRSGWITGIIKRIIEDLDNKIKVEWQNKAINSYTHTDLLHLNYLDKIPKKNIKKDLDELCYHLYAQKEGIDF